MQRKMVYDDRCFDRLDFPLAVRTQTAQMSLPLHTHTYEELVLIESGTADHLVNANEHFPLSTGDAFVISPHSAHGFAAPRQLALVNIRFHLERLALPLTEMRKLPGYRALFELEPRYRRKHRFRSRLRLCMTDLKHALSLAHDMGRELTQRAPGYEFAALSGLMSLIAFLCRCYGRSTSPLSQPLLRVDSAIQHLEAHYREPVSIAELACLTRQSVNSLLRDFKSATTQSPIQYLLSLRLRKAADLLIQYSSMNITEVALAVGFNDSNYFARQFRRTFNLSPRVFRQQAGDRH